MGSGHPAFVPYQAFRTGDGRYIYVSVFTEKFWRAFCAALGREELAEDSRFDRNTKRVENRDALVRMIEGWLIEGTCDEWTTRFVAAGVPCGPVKTMGEALNDPQLLHNEMVVELQHPVAGTIRGLGSVVKFRGTPVEYRTPPPVLGEHTNSVLEELGYTAEDIAELERLGAL